jgi:hypothetical protein
VQAESRILRNCFERVAEAGVDITPQVFREFEAATPGVGQHIAMMDPYMRGRMLEQVIKLLMGETEDGYLAFEVRTHHGYGANDAFYRSLLEAVKQVVRELSGGSWTEHEDAAWDSTIERIVGEIGELGAA